MSSLRALFIADRMHLWSCQYMLYNYNYSYFYLNCLEQMEYVHAVVIMCYLLLLLIFLLKLFGTDWVRSYNFLNNEYYHYLYFH